MNRDYDALIDELKARVGQLVQVSICPRGEPSIAQFTGYLGASAAQTGMPPDFPEEGMLFVLGDLDRTALRSFTVFRDGLQAWEAHDVGVEILLYDVLVTVGEVAPE